MRDFIGQRSPVGESALSGVLQRFVVSPKIAAIALCQAAYIDEATKQEWRTLTAPKLAARFGWADQYQVLQASSDRRRAPQRLLARAITGYAEGVLPAQAIATLRGISLEALEEELREAGVTPAERPIARADPAELPDDVTPELATVVQRISGLPIAERMKHAKDLGETMVIAHAVVAAESGQPVTVLYR